MSHTERAGATGTDTALRLSVWSGPRNVSTALMYAFRSRPDTIVFDEPLYGPYLANEPVAHPAQADLLRVLPLDADAIVRDVLLGDAPPAGPGTMGFAERGVEGIMPKGATVRMYKNMAHHLRGLDRTFLGNLRNILLTRDPRAMLPSLAVQLGTPTLADTGLVEQVELLERDLEAGRHPVVIDAARLLQDPERVLRSVCDAVELPWEAAMLRWEPGGVPEDGVWAPHWYHSVQATSGFEPQVQVTRTIEPELADLVRESVPLYERLMMYAI